MMTLSLSLLFSLLACEPSDGGSVSLDDSGDADADSDADTDASDADAAVYHADGVRPQRRNGRTYQIVTQK